MKQKLRFYYGNIKKIQFKKIYEETSRKKGDTSEKIIEFLECRLDAFVCRVKWSATVFVLRQAINHGHVLINGKRVNISSYRLKEGDEIKIVDKMKEKTPV